MSQLNSHETFCNTIDGLTLNHMDESSMIEKRGVDFFRDLQNFEELLFF